MKHDSTYGTRTWTPEHIGHITCVARELVEEEAREARQQNTQGLRHGELEST